MPTYTIGANGNRDWAPTSTTAQKWGADAAQYLAAQRNFPVDIGADQMGIWRLDEGQGAVAVDQSGNANRGLIGSAMIWDTDSVATFLRSPGTDPTNQYLDIPAIPHYLWPEGQQWALQWWFKWPAVTDRYGPVFRPAHVGIYDNGADFYIQPNGDTTCQIYKRGGAAVGWWDDNGAWVAYADNQWHIWTANFWDPGDGSGSLDLYIDNALIGTHAGTALPPPVTGWPPWCFFNTSAPARTINSASSMAQISARKLLFTAYERCFWRALAVVAGHGCYSRETQDFGTHQTLQQLDWTDNAPASNERLQSIEIDDGTQQRTVWTYGAPGPPVDLAPFNFTDAATYDIWIAQRHSTDTAHRYAHQLAAITLTYQPAITTAASNPTVEGKTNPAAVTDLQPEFGWDYSDPNDYPQTAYHILVASSQQLLDDNTGDLWDTQPTESSDTEAEYAGSSLAELTIYFWKVRVRNSEGEWSEDW